MNIGDIVTYKAPGFKPREFRVTGIGPESLLGQEYKMVPLDGRYAWEREATQ